MVRRASTARSQTVVVFKPRTVGDASLGWSRLRLDALNNRALHGLQRVLDLSRALAALHAECLLARTARLADVRHLRSDPESRGRVEQRERDSRNASSAAQATWLSGMQTSTTPSRRRRGTVRAGGMPSDLHATHAGSARAFEWRVIGDGAPLPQMD